jgi:response regulator RpfG family c-di-GMP phosphodiesterase
MKDKKDKPKILYVDDEQSNLIMFTATFRHDYEIFTAQSGKEGLQILSEHPIEVIVTDQRMPDMNGVEFLLEVLNKYPLPIRIIVTAYTDVDTIIKCVNDGKIFSYITKPWNEVEVKHILENAIKIYRLEKSDRELLLQLQAKSVDLREINDALEMKVLERTKELENSQNELLKTSHLTGMAEVTMGMIHNVSNILNSLNVSAAIIGERIQQSQLANLIECSKLMDKHKNDLGDYLTKDPKGSLLPQYMMKVIESLQMDFVNIAKEITNFRKNVTIISEIITTQQSLSSLKNSDKAVEVQAILEDAVKISGYDFERNNITIQRDYVALKAVLINKIKLLQILINLIINAKQALMSVDQEHKILILKINQPKKDTFSIEIIDNGAGIDAADLNKMFQYGFTTKVQGHGYGLHSSSIAAEEMRGKIEIYSEGLGKGTTVTLLLPYEEGPLET